MKTIVGEKGQVTIPKPLRDSLGLIPGTELDVREEGGAIVARRLVRTDPLDAVLGVLPRANADALLAASRGPAWRADLDGRRRDCRRR